MSTSVRPPRMFDIFACLRPQVLSILLILRTNWYLIRTKFLIRTRFSSRMDMCNVHIHVCAHQGGGDGRISFRNPGYRSFFVDLTPLRQNNWLLVHRPFDRACYFDKSRVVWQVLSCYGCGLPGGPGRWKLLTVHIPVHVHFYGGWAARLWPTGGHCLRTSVAAR